MSNVIKFGPFWDRAVFDPQGRVVKYRGKTVCRFEDIKSLRIREYLSREEENQLPNVHLDVQKSPREAELWVDAKDGRSVRIASLDQAGLLLSEASRAAAQAGVPVVSERSEHG